MAYHSRKSKPKHVPEPTPTDNYHANLEDAPDSAPVDTYPATFEAEFEPLDYWASHDARFLPPALNEDQVEEMEAWVQLNSPGKDSEDRKLTPAEKQGSSQRTPRPYIKKKINRRKSSQRNIKTYKDSLMKK
jgi:hypothetical protein